MAVLVASAAPAYSGAGRTSGNFLKIGASPRAMGMGETGAGLSDDALTAAHMNPAGLARLALPEAGFAYSILYEDISLQHVAVGYPTRRLGTFGLAGSFLQMKGFEGYDNSGVRLGDVKAADYAVKAAYARRLLGPENDLRYGLFIGAAAKYARNELDIVKSNAVMADGGLLFVHPLGPGVLGLGGAALSAGQGFKFDAERDKAATVYRTGVSYTLPVWGDPLVLAGDVKMPVYDDFSYAAGLEYTVRRLIALRGGFISHQSLGAGWRMGLGFKIKFLQADYALSEYGKMGYTHLMGVSIRFGEPIEVTPHRSPAAEKALKLIRKAKDLMRESRNYEAAVQLNEALELDPNSKEALQLLRDVRDALERSQ